MHEKQKQLDVGVLVSSQKRRAAAVPQINRFSTKHFVPPPVCIGFFVRASEETFKKKVFDALEGKSDGRPQSESTRRRPVLLRLAPPRRIAVGRPAPIRPRFVRAFDSTNLLTIMQKQLSSKIFRITNYH